MSDEPTKPGLSVVQLHSGLSLQDISGLLRQTADAIDAGEYDEVRSAILLLPRDGSYPIIFGWGDVDGERHPIVQLELAKIWLATQATERT